MFENLSFDRQNQQSYLIMRTFYSIPNQQSSCVIRNFSIPGLNQPSSWSTRDFFFYNLISSHPKMWEITIFGEIQEFIFRKRF